MKKVLLASLALLLLAFFALPAMATVSQVTSLVTTDGSSYFITGLNYSDGTPVRLFQPPSNDPIGQPPLDTPPDLWWHNNRSTLVGDGYPSYVPSPGYSAAGETFDIEGVFWTYSSGQLNVWVVTSIAPQDPNHVDSNGTVVPLNGAEYNNNHYLMGDVFVNTDGDDPYDYALISFGNSAPNTGDDGVGNQSWSNVTTRDAGDLAVLDGNEDLYGINGPSSYANHDPIPGEANPWAVEHPDVFGDTSHNLVYQEITGSVVEGLDGSLSAGLPTYVYLFTVTGLSWGTSELTWLSVPNPNEDEVTPGFHVTVQCGNDEGGNPDGQGGGQIPAPGALILGIIGAGLVGLRRRMKA